jgi:DNA-directed RNA polymerase specialized sigma24 family protein
METVERLRILRNYETLCYRVCCYLLQDEEQAAAAAQQAMLELFAHAAFFNCPGDEKERIVRKIAARHALRAARERLALRASRSAGPAGRPTRCPNRPPDPVA